MELPGTASNYLGVPGSMHLNVDDTGHVRYRSNAGVWYRSTAALPDGGAEVRVHDTGVITFEALIDGRWIQLGASMTSGSERVAAMEQQCTVESPELTKRWRVVSPAMRCQLVAGHDGEHHATEEHADGGDTTVRWR